MKGEVEVEEEKDPLQGAAEPDLDQLITAATEKIDIVVQLTEPIEDLIKVLQRSVEGLALLSDYKANRNLTKCDRTTLVDIIVDEEIRSSRQLR